MLRSPLSAKVKISMPFTRKEMGNDNTNDKNKTVESPDEDDEIVSLQFDDISSCSDSGQEDAKQHTGGSFHNSTSSISSSVSSSFHSSSSRFMDSMRNIKILPRLKPTLEKYNELPDESGGNSSAELALELEKIAMNTPCKASEICEVEPADPHLLSNLEEAMRMENNSFSIVLAHQEGDCDQLNISPLSADRRLVNLPPVTPRRRSPGASRLVPKDRTPQTPRRRTPSRHRHRHPSSSKSTRKSIKTISDVALHKSSPGYLDHAQEDIAPVPPRRSSHNGRQARQNRSNTANPRRRFRRTQPNHSPLLVSSSGATTPITITRNRRRMSLMAAPDLNRGGGLSDDHLHRGQMFLSRPEGTLQRGISTDSSDLGRIVGLNKSPSLAVNSSIGELKADFLGKSPKRERTKFDFDPKSLKDVMPEKANPDATASTDKRKVKIHPVIALRNSSLIGL